MKKKLLYFPLCALFLLTAACTDPSPQSLRKAQNEAILLPPESMEDSAMSAPPSAVEVVSDPDSIYAEAEMRTFLTGSGAENPPALR